jgi:hypothetical protein
MRHPASHAGDASSPAGKEWGIKDRHRHTQLAVRAGTKLVVTTGLVAMAAFYAWVAATISAALAYGIIAAQMVVYGLGLGLTSGDARPVRCGRVTRTVTVPRSQPGLPSMPSDTDPANLCRSAATKSPVTGSA